MKNSALHGGSDLSLYIEEVPIIVAMFLGTLFQQIPQRTRALSLGHTSMNFENVLIRMVKYP